MVKCMITSWERNKWKQGLLVKGMYPELGTLLQSYTHACESGAHPQGIGTMILDRQVFVGTIMLEDVNVSQRNRFIIPEL